MLWGAEAYKLESEYYLVLFFWPFLIRLEYIFNMEKFWGMAQSPMSYSVTEKMSINEPLTCEDIQRALDALERCERVPFDDYSGKILCQVEGSREIIWLSWAEAMKRYTGAFGYLMPVVTGK